MSPAPTRDGTFDRQIQLSKRLCGIMAKYHPYGIVSGGQVRELLFPKTSQPGGRRTAACGSSIVTLNQQAPDKPARRPLPAELPRETEIIAPAQEACLDCGGALRRLGEDVTETLEYVPARFKVIRTMRPKLSCAGCSRIVQVPAPNRPSIVVWPGLGCWRTFCWRSTPITYRFIASRRSIREGVELDRSTLAGWVGGASRTLQPRPAAVTRTDVLRMVTLRALEAGLPSSTCCHTFRVIGITAYRENDGR
jgi:hypothetical protein